MTASGPPSGPKAGKGLWALLRCGFEHTAARRPSKTRQQATTTLESSPTIQPTQPPESSLLFRNSSSLTSLPQLAPPFKIEEHVRIAGVRAYFQPNTQPQEAYFFYSENHTCIGDTASRNCNQGLQAVTQASLSCLEVGPMPPLGHR